MGSEMCIRDRNCSVHVTSNLEKKLNSVRDKDIREEIISDIALLQLCESEQVFDAAVTLFMKKWEKEVPEFLLYLKESWLGENKYWFEGSALHIPSTNNGIESTNRVIKRQFTFRERLPVDRFFTVCLDMPQYWSSERDPCKPTNSKPFALLPEPSLELWTSAFNWARSDAVAAKFGSHFYIKPSANKSRAKFENQIKAYESKRGRLSWKSCLLYTSPSPRDLSTSRMPSSA